MVPYGTSPTSGKTLLASIARKTPPTKYCSSKITVTKGNACHMPTKEPTMKKASMKRSSSTSWRDIQPMRASVLYRSNSLTNLMKTQAVHGEVAEKFYDRPHLDERRTS